MLSKSECQYIDFSLSFETVLLLVHHIQNYNMWNYNFYIYVTTNPTKTALYVGVTNDLSRRLFEHIENKGNNASYAGKYHCYNLIYYEHFSNIEHAIEREKEIKKWSRKKKIDLIATMNPSWKFLNNVFTD